MSIKRLLSLIILAIFAMAVYIQCKPGNSMQASNNTTLSQKGLKDYYKDFFPIGVAVRPESLKGADSALIVREFNSLTAENAMKMGPIHPKENEYYWKDADAIVDFAQAHHMRVRGHNLLWHNQAPRWLFTDSATGKQVTKKVLLQRLKDHITTVVNRYKGKIYAWDVVNEAINDDTSSRFMRNSLWYQICGDDFIPKAFEYAHAADPKAVLFYNDYNTERASKRDKVYRLLKQLIDAKVPINAVGLQAHWNVNDPTGEQLRESIEKFSSLGLKVQITELDISVYPSGLPRPAPAAAGTAPTPPPPAVFTPEMEQKQLEQYKMAFNTFREYKKNITGVTFWNISDRSSWLDTRGRKNFPLLFDQDRQPKKAYWEVVKF